MFAVINNLISTALVVASTFGNPTTANELSFDASAFVTTNNQIRLSISKPTTERLTVVLRDAENHVLYQQVIAKNESKSALLFSVNDLADGQYEIEIRSNEGSIRKQISLSTKVQQPVRQIAMQ